MECPGYRKAGEGEGKEDFCLQYVLVHCVFKHMDSLLSQLLTVAYAVGMAPTNRKVQQDLPERKSEKQTQANELFQILFPHARALVLPKFCVLGAPVQDLLCQ